MSEDKNNYGILKFYDLDLISNIVLNKIEENKVCEFIFNEESKIYSILNKVLESFLIKFNKVLLISDNIEELYRHIEIINSLKENIYDVSMEENIEERLKNQIASLPENTGRTILSKIEVLNRRIDKNMELLNKIITFFYNKDNEGLSLVEKYYITERIISNNEKNHYYYKIFRIKKPFKNLTYYEIKTIKEEIERRNLTPLYITYRRYLDNSRFMILQKNIENSVREEAIKELEDINKRNLIKIDYLNLKYKKDFIDNFIINQDMKPIEVEELANIVNMKYNSHLLEKKIDKSFFSFFKKKKSEFNNDNIEKYNYIKKDILKDFNHIYINIKSELNKFEFLSKILIKEEYNDFKLMLIKGDNVYEKIKLYYKLIQLSKNIEGVKSNIEALDSNTREVLDYCYDSIEYKNDLEDIIKNIHKIKLYYDIENIELSNEGIIEEYKHFNIIKERLYNDTKSRDLLIKEGIKLLWDNLIRETYKVSSFNKDKIDYNDKETFKNITPIVLSDNNKIFEDNIFSGVNSFDKIILFDTKESLDLEIINENIEKNKLLLFKKKINESIDETYRTNIIDLNKIKEISIKDNYVNCSIINDIIAYINTKGYIINEDINYNKDIYKLIIGKLNSNKKLGVIIDTEICNYQENYYIKELYLQDIEEDFFVYRIWSRDIWINKNKVFEELFEYAKEVFNTNA